MNSALAQQHAFESCNTAVENKKSVMLRGISAATKWYTQRHQHVEIIGHSRQWRRCRRRLHRTLRVSMHTIRHGGVRRAFTTAGSYLTAFAFCRPLLARRVKDAGRASERWLIATGLAVIATSISLLITASILSAFSLVVYVCLVGTLWSIAYPIVQTDVLSLLSKVIKSPPLGGLICIV